MQFQNNIVLVLLTALLLSAGCNKDKNVKTVVNGTVINLSENKPLGGAEVTLRETYGFASNTGFNVKETTITDANGKFSFDFVATPSRNYEVFINRGDLYLSSVFEKIEKGKTNDVVLKPETFGYIKLILDNSFGGDSVKLKTYMVGPDENFEVTYYPWSSVSENYSKVRSGLRYYEIKQFNSGNENVIFDTLFVERYQEHELEIKF